MPTVPAIRMDEPPQIPRADEDAAGRLSGQHYRFLAESIPQIVFAAEPDGTPEYFNQRWRDYTGLADDGGVRFEQVIHPDDLPLVRARWAESRGTGQTWECEYRLRRHDGAYRWHLGRSVAWRDPATGEIAKWFGTCTDIHEQKRTRDALRFLAEASEVLASSLDYEMTLASVARLAVPHLGDWCVVDVLGEGGEVRRLAVAHVDPSKVQLAEELQQRYPPRPDAPHGLPNVLRTGKSELYADVSDELIDATTRGAEHAAAVRSLGLRSVMVVPMAARGRTVGAITFVTAESDRRYGPADLALAEDLARRAATAVDNARLYGEAQEALRREARSAALLDTLFASSPTGLAFYDREFRFQRVNDALAAINGVPAADHVGKTYAEVVPHVWPTVRPHFGRVLASGEPVVDVEVTGDTPADPGKPRTWLTSWYPVLDAARNVMGLGGVITDITGRKRAEEALWAANASLRESNDRFEIVARATNDAVWDWDLSTNEVTWYAGPEQLFGFDPRQVAKDIQWWAGQIHPDDRARVVAGMHAAVVGGGSAVWRDEYRFRRADGTYAHVYDRGSVLRDERGAAVRMIGAMADVSERRAAQEALRVSRERLDLVLGATDLGLWYCDLPLDKLVWNARCKEHFFLPPDAEVTIGTFFERIHPDDRENTRRAIERSIGSREPFDTDYRTVSPDGRRVRWVRAIGRAFYDDAGRPRRFDGITIDVTERRQAEEELKRAKETAEAANAAKDHFLAVLSHELRTPLSPVLSTVQAMEDEPGLRDEWRESLEMIRRNVEMEARLIDDLLDLTRISKGKLELHVQTVDAHACLAHAVEICRADLAAKRLRLEADPAAARRHVRGDAARLQQVFWNLIKNAVKFTPEGGTVTVRTRNEEVGSGEWRVGRKEVEPGAPAHSIPHTPLPASSSPALIRIEVADTGIGIEPDVLPRIFDAFEQGERSITRRFGGLGLGLAISKALVDMQGGRLSAASAGKGRGAVFSVELAVVEPKPDDLAHPAGLGPGGARRGDVRILLVDDHADTARAMSRLLARSGYQVAVAGSVNAALDAFSRGGDTFDLLISDIGLPDGSGLELMRQIREMQQQRNPGDPAHPPRPLRGIALSGFGMEEDVRRSKEAGFFEHLTKPVHFPRLQEVIRQATEGEG